MILMPAVDIYGGRVVRMIKGRPHDMLQYSDAPFHFASDIVSKGAQQLHIVDLDAALSTGHSNIDAIRDILTVGARVQVAGGIRSTKKAESLLAMGAHRIVMSTLFFEKPEVAERIISSYGSDSLVIAVDYRGGRVLSKGWSQDAGLSLHKALALAVRNVSWVLITDTDRDGTMTGPDVTTIEEVRKDFPELRIMAAGGISCISDLKAMKRVGVDCAIIGRAIAEGQIDLARALREVGGC